MHIVLPSDISIYISEFLDKSTRECLRRTCKNLLSEIKFDDTLLYSLALKDENYSILEEQIKDGCRYDSGLVKELATRGQLDLLKLVRKTELTGCYNHSSLYDKVKGYVKLGLYNIGFLTKSSWNAEDLPLVKKNLQVEMVKWVYDEHRIGSNEGFKMIGMSQNLNEAKKYICPPGFAHFFGLLCIPVWVWTGVLLTSKIIQPWIYYPGTILSYYTGKYFGYHIGAFAVTNKYLSQIIFKFPDWAINGLKEGAIQNNNKEVILWLKSRGYE